MKLHIYTLIGADGKTKIVSFDHCANDTDIQNYLKAHHNDDKVMDKERIDTGKIVDFKQPELTIESAKQFLKDNGYFVDNLWSVNDVKGKFECTDEQAQKVLSSALQNEATTEQIQFAINIHAEFDNLPKKSKYFSISGFWRDTNENFENRIVKETDYEGDQEPNDEDIFYYGLNESALINLIALGHNTSLEFVITSYEETTLN